MTRWLRIALAVYFLALLFLNLFFIPYPADNDLQFIGWIAERLSLARPESLVERNFTVPGGFLLLLRALTPAFGSIVRAALFCQTVASTLGIALVFAITRKIFADERAAAAAALAAAVVNFPVAITEFGDCISTLAILFGLWVLVEEIASPRRNFLLGVTIGIAYLIRFHYLTFVLIFPAALVAARAGWRALVSCSLALWAGFLLSASPLIALNLMVHGMPFHTGLSSYIVGYVVVDALDWYDFPSTYALWPVWRVVREKPGALLLTMLKNAGGFLHPFALSTLIASAAGMVRLPRYRRMATYLLAVVGGYVLLNIVAARYTNRSAYPAFMLLSILAMGLAVPLHWPRWLERAALAGIAAGLAVHGYKQVALVRARRADMKENQEVLRVLKEHGFKSSAEVFCNDWNVYNLDHPYLDPFYDYGGYMLLDREFATRRPLPRGALPKGIRFVILLKGLPAPGVPQIPASSKIYSDAKLDVYEP